MGDRRRQIRLRGQGGLSTLHVLSERDTHAITLHQQQVEPARRAYEELGVKSVITGRRATQGGDRASLKPLEVDETGLIKLNPLFAWTFPFVEWYIEENKVPRNKLLDQGYRSVGDWHSTIKVGEGEGERAGRWAGKEKTECGLHKDYYAMKAKVDKTSEAIKPPATSAVPVTG